MPRKTRSKGFTSWRERKSYIWWGRKIRIYRQQKTKSEKFTFACPLIFRPPMNIYSPKNIYAKFYINRLRIRENGKINIFFLFFGQILICVMYFCNCNVVFLFGKLLLELVLNFFLLLNTNLASYFPYYAEFWSSLVVNIYANVYCLK